jgi:hypothetical protein
MLIEKTTVSLNELETTYKGLSEVIVAKVSIGSFPAVQPISDDYTLSL